MRGMSRRTFVATAAGVTAGAVLRVPALAGQNQSAPPAAGGVPKPAGNEVVAARAVPFPTKGVRLQPGVFSAAAEANRKYLKTLPTDRLLHTFRLNAGLPSTAEPLGEWKSRTANCAAILPAGITFRRARCPSPALGTSN